jgi:hypothetical protein
MLLFQNLKLWRGIEILEFVLYSWLESFIAKVYFLINNLDSPIGYLIFLLFKS